MQEADLTECVQGVSMCSTLCVTHRPVPPGALPSLPPGTPGRRGTGSSEVASRIEETEESMGTVKEENRKKTTYLHVRFTPSDMETVRRNCRIAGYGSLSRFVRTRLTAAGPSRKAPSNPDTPSAASTVPEWLREEMGRLSQQVRGVAANYNQAVSVLNALVKSVSGRDTQRLIIRRAARLDVLTHEMVDTLQEMKRLVEKATADPQEDD